MFGVLHVGRHDEKEEKRGWDVICWGVVHENRFGEDIKYNNIKIATSTHTLG
jgi:hypothetical protein